MEYGAQHSHAGSGTEDESPKAKQSKAKQDNKQVIFIPQNISPRYTRQRDTITTEETLPIHNPSAFLAG